MALMGGSRACTVLRFIASFSETEYNCISKSTSNAYNNSPKFPRSHHHSSITGIRLPVSHAGADDHGVFVALSGLHHGLAR